jgi:hypothetical protein
MRIGRERRSQRNAVPELAGMDVDHSLSDLVPGTVAGDLGEHPGRLHSKTLPCIHEWQGYQSVDA